VKVASVLGQDLRSKPALLQAITEAAGLSRMIASMLTPEALGRLNQLILEYLTLPPIPALTTEFQVLAG